MVDAATWSEDSGNNLTYTTATGDSGDGISFAQETFTAPTEVPGMGLPDDAGIDLVDTPYSYTSYLTEVSAGCPLCGCVMIK